MLKPLLLFSAVILFAITTAPTPGLAPQEAAPGAKGSSKANADALAKAKRIYAIDCALCHGATGDGKTDLAKDMQLVLSDWTDPKSLEGKADKELFDAIRKGKGKMPAEDVGRAKDDDLWNLILYIRTFSANQPAAPATPPAPAAPAGPGR